MRKYPICFLLTCLTITLTGCVSNSDSESHNGLSNGESGTVNSPADNDTAAKDYISLTSEIMPLKSGFSAVRYDSEYAFDIFPEQDGGAFGCSTISVADTSGGYLFGRNFDRQFCAAEKAK